jgi:S-DNA-T family DNA segregation ATPase FtsK/SpoIIIE
MGRRKKRKSSSSAPFVFSTNKGTIFNIIGFLVLAAGIISLVSFFIMFSDNAEGNGRLLYLLNQTIVEYFGWTSIFVPFILLLMSGHFFNSERLKLVKPNVTIGLLFICLALMGTFATGAWGGWIHESLTLDFSPAGAYIIFAICFFIGIVLFFDTSIDVFVVAVLDFFKSMASGAKNVVIKDKEAKEDDPKKDEKEKYEFIKDTKAELPQPPKIQIPQPGPATVVVPDKKAIHIKPTTTATSSTWVYPPLTLLHDVKQADADRGDVARNADIIEKTLDSFGIRARVAELNKGPTVTQYALEITMGTKLSKITALANDLALALAAPTGAVRIEAPIPGRSLVGVEIPNIRSQMVTLKQMLESPTFDSPDPLLVPLGLDVSGQPIATSVGRMPHVLIAGTTGSGKSVILNAWLSTFLFRTRPDELRLILVDPKRVEMTQYNGLPHLLTEVIVEPQKILSALQWTVAEMESRYKQFAEVGVRNLEGYNKLEGVEKKPFIIFVIDELADLMMFASKDAEDLITRIAQMARATGIHLVLATQRPSVDVITGLMKANIPTRLAFNVSSMIDSRVIIDGPGAEKLLGRGDMLFMPPDQAKPRRMQGAFVDEKEVGAVANFLKSQVPEVHYTEEITAKDVSAGGKPGAGGGGGGEGSDPLFQQSVEIIGSFDKASASLLQRRLKIGYARAARILDELEQAGYVGPAEGSKPREVLNRGVSSGTDSADGME